MPREKRTELICVRLEPSLKDELTALANREERSLSQQAHKLLREALARAAGEPGRLRNARPEVHPPAASAARTDPQRRRI